VPVRVHIRLRAGRAAPGGAPLIAAVAFVVILVVPVSALGGAGSSTRAVDGSSSRLSGASSGAASAPFLTIVPQNASYNWPEFHQDPNLLGYEANSSLSSANASGLGVGWSTYLYGSALDSPSVAYDPLLKETLAYIGTEAGYFMAVNVANGQVVWSDWFGSIIRTSSLVWNDSVYVATFTNPEVLRLNATDGAVQARAISPDPIEGTPTLATPPGGVPTLFMPTLDVVTSPAPFLALNAVNLTTEWTFEDYNRSAGSWAPASYGETASGVPLVIFGTDNPDSSIYAVNALTGTRVWWFQCDNPDDGDWDVAAGPTISAPGVNGFAQGMVYAINKYSRVYALDLNNGTLAWEFNFRSVDNIHGGVSRSTAALVGQSLVFGYEMGLIDYNVVTRTQVWTYHDPTKTESIAAPAVAGPTGQQVVITDDVGGDLDVVSLATGTQLYTYSTGGYFTSSPAIFDGNIVTASSNGFLYDFAVGGGNEAVLPATSISHPLQDANLTNPDGDLAIRGNASDAVGVARVFVAIEQDGYAGEWWNNATGTWVDGPVNNPASLATPDAASTSWSLRVPVPASGATYQVYANAVSTTGPEDQVGADVTFAVAYNVKGPHLELSPAYVPPGGTVTVKGGGFGSDQKVIVTFQGKVVAHLKTQRNGGLAPTPLTLASNASFGLSSITVTSEKNASEASSAPLTVANSWDQQGYSPGHDGYEANDGVLNYLVFPGSNTWVKMAWKFDGGAPVNASPAVVDDVAYVADTHGDVFAVDVRNAGLLWTTTLASGAEIGGSPAVDESLGLLFVGADDGNLYAMSTRNGSLAWTASIGGHLSAPVFSGGVLFVSSTSGKVVAVSESSGATLWTASFSSAILAPPSYNATADLLVVSCSGGDVVALNASSGSIRWTYSTGGAVDDSAVVASGAVFVGSKSGYEYSIDETSGALLWSFDAKSGIDAAAAIVYSHTTRPYTVVVGTESGKVYNLKGLTGTVQFSNDGGSAIVGVAAVRGIQFFVTVDGKIGSVRTYVSTNAVFWHFQAAAGASSAPVIVDGTIYFASQDGDVYAFDDNGVPPD
jgi:outer membrane protein assembly factor BamB